MMDKNGSTDTGVSKMLQKIVVCGFLAAIAVAPSCGPAEDSPVATSELPASYWLASAPDGALDVKNARQTATDGSEIVVIGRVGELLDARAQFHLVDRSFDSCNLRPEDECETPWDYCCIEATELKGGTLVVEFRDGDQLLKTTTRSFHGLDHLKEVVVRGKVIKDQVGNLIIVASGIHVKA